MYRIHFEPEPEVSVLKHGPINPLTDIPTMVADGTRKEIGEMPVCAAIKTEAVG